MDNSIAHDKVDSAYREAHYQLSELNHNYHSQVHILGDPFALNQLARLCHPDTHQPDFNLLINQLYTHLLTAVINCELPRAYRQIPTRMFEHTDRGVFAGEVLDEMTKVVSVDIARAGILPSQVCYDVLNQILPPQNVRQDHLLMSRVTHGDKGVVGAQITGQKVGGKVDGRIVLFPDPMGATGNSMVAAIDYYKENYGIADKFITLNLIITPQFIRALLDKHPEVQVYALRLDRGMSDSEILHTKLGEKWDEESGLNDEDYIVPGGGGFGEIMNNSFV